MELSNLFVNLMFVFLRAPQWRKFPRRQAEISVSPGNSGTLKGSVQTCSDFAFSFFVDTKKHVPTLVGVPNR